MRAWWVVAVCACSEPSVIDPDAGCDCGPFAHFEGDVCVADIVSAVCDPGTVLVWEDTGAWVCRPVPVDRLWDTLPGCCGPGTHYDPIAGGVCMPDDIQCDPQSTPYVDADGMLHCPRPSNMGCDLACPPPTPGNVTVCGQLVDAETGGDVAVSRNGQLCDPDSPLPGGPCALSISFYPALPFVGNPEETPALVPGALYVNHCGRFAAIDIEEPMLGFLAVAVTGADHVVAAQMLPAPEGTRRNNITATAIRTSTDALWTAGAGDPFGGETFADHGASLFTYLHAGQPVAGVMVTADGETLPQSDYYFADSTPWTRTQVDPGLDATGANGSVLLVDSTLVDHSGTGGEPAGCYWPEDLTTTTAGVIFVDLKQALTADQAEDPCP